MTTNNRIESVSLSIARITPTTHWAFIEIVDGQGRIGAGEATLNGRDNELEHEANLMFQQLEHLDLNEATLLLQARELRSLPAAAIVSALSHACADLIGQQLGCRVAELFGGVVRETIPLYANINRCTRSRSPLEFAKSARTAVSAGYTALKIAPFDGITLYGASERPDRGLISVALDRIQAVRDAIGTSVELMVDCHWRLNAWVAREMLSSTACDGLHWLECPIPETSANLAELRALRTYANRRGIRLAGCEEAVRASGFMPFIEAGAYDVMMPDIKYVGGVQEMLEIARSLERHGIEFSPHNPSGPIAHAVSLQICALTPNFNRLEIQFDETPLFTSLVDTRLPRPANGLSAVPNHPGIGVRLDHAELDPLTVQHLTSLAAREKAGENEV
ncbi:hypothetical protein WL93_18045 [Burkholderia diffusa]|uniref:mandelate racemase/muconate lactonizing enzyme family protein n=1 Tax=Burkholderia diffusa TaxID=488732 RepID=UPI0007578CCA|nr:mandelate racemase/muconate lactonizing enzyme family protein [Burkholderia diffusa]KWF86758.1 hypothetical protein WL93_18045 [Burkholderia diffusa]